MQKLNIQPTQNSPKIILDKEENILEISGKSFPENALKFYTPVIEWFDEYLKAPNPETVLVLNITYHNTATSKTFMHILRQLNILFKHGNDAAIHWYCHEDDDDAIEEGEDYADLVSVPIVIKFR